MPACSFGRATADRQVCRVVGPISHLVLAVRQSVRSTSRLLWSAPSPPTMHAMSGVMFSMTRCARNISKSAYMKRCGARQPPQNRCSTIISDSRSNTPNFRKHPIIVDPSASKDHWSSLIVVSDDIAAYLVLAYVLRRLDFCHGRSPTGAGPDGSRPPHPDQKSYMRPRLTRHTDCSTSTVVGFGDRRAEYV